MEQNTKYYQKSHEETLGALKTSRDGLTGAEAGKRLETYGKNALSEGKKESALQVFLGQFKDLMVFLLMGAAIISAISGNVESTIVIFAVLVMNAVLGTVQHMKAEKSLESLKAMSAPAAKVLRDGQRTIVSSPDIVPGDILELEAGDMVAADARVLENYSLKVDESSLTGESEGVDKHANIIEGDVALGDRKNMVFSGSLVTYGRATVVVTATGMSTELGRVATLMNQAKERRTPLQISLDNFSKKLAMAIMAICVVVFGMSMLHGENVLNALMFAVALAVAAIPEALGSIITIVQAMGTQRMARQQAIIKDLKAVETLGCVSVICSDKTGTLTQNRMTPQEMYTDGSIYKADALDLSNDPCRTLLKSALLDSDATTTGDKPVGDPTEVALVMMGDTLGVTEVDYRSQHPRLAELAFDSDRKLMSTLHEIDGAPTMYTKGALDVLLPRCSHILTSSGPKVMEQTDLDAINQINANWSDQGLRVLAFAYKNLDSVRELTLADEQGYTFLGLVSMIDPPRMEAVRAVADAKHAGIRTVMITGDHKATAASIARQLGIFQEGDEAVSGPELDAMEEAELDRRLEHISVYARVSPEHKIRIVEAWQRKGRIVSMTGDGVNDAPALKAADIGVAMGITGTEVSKDAADMILSDDNFATIVNAVVNGRGVYSNIKNAISFLLSGNMAAILCVFLASALGLPMPFAPVHLLFINLLTDSLPAIAIGMELAGAGLLDQQPRSPKEPILNKDLSFRILSCGILIAAAVSGAYFIGLRHGAGEAMTLAFATLTLARLFHGFNCRGDKSIFKLGLLTNKASLGAFAVGIILLAIVLFIPFMSHLFQVSPFSMGELGMVVLLAFLPTVVVQLYKVLCRDRKHH